MSYSQRYETVYQTGLTLVELIMVFVILGMLTVVTIPKFIGLEHEMRLSAMNSLEGAMRSANLVIYSRSAMQDASSFENYHLDLDGDGEKDLHIRYGYASSMDDLVKAMRLESMADFTVLSENSQDTVKNQISHAFAEEPQYCHIDYQRAMNVGDMPEYTSEISNCQ